MTDESYPPPPPPPPPSGQATTPTGPSRRAPLAMIIGVVVLAVLTVILLVMLLTRDDGTASSLREPDAIVECHCLGQRFSFTRGQPERDSGRHPIRRPAGSARPGGRYGRGDDRREPDRARRSRARCRTSWLARKRGPLVRRRRADRRRRLPLVPRLGSRPAAELRLCRREAPRPIHTTARSGSAGSRPQARPASRGSCEQDIACPDGTAHRREPRRRANRARAPRVLRVGSDHIPRLVARDPR